MLEHCAPGWPLACHGTVGNAVLSGSPASARSCSAWRHGQVCGVEQPWPCTWMAFVSGKPLLGLLPDDAASVEGPVCSAVLQASSDLLPPVILKRLLSPPGLRRNTSMPLTTSPPHPHKHMGEPRIPKHPATQTHHPPRSIHSTTRRHPGRQPCESIRAEPEKPCTQLPIALPPDPFCQD